MVICHSCDQEYTNIAKHWGHSCPYPEITNGQWSIFNGLMLGDGSIGGKSDGNPFIQIEMCNKEFLEWVKSKLGILATTVRKSKSTTKMAQSNYNHGYSPHNNPDKYQQPYKLETRRLPELSGYITWYDNNSKSFPENIELNPVSLAVWFVCDGSNQYQHGGYGKNYITIHSASHGFEKDKILSWFDDFSINPRWQRLHGLRFTVDDSEWLWNYMYGPLPGFEYKWPENYSQ